MQVMPPWFPRADGTFLKEPVRDAVRAGRIADVPFIVGQSSFAREDALPYTEWPHRYLLR